MANPPPTPPPKKNTLLRYPASLCLSSAQDSQHLKGKRQGMYLRTHGWDFGLCITTSPLPRLCPAREAARFTYQVSTTQQGKWPPVCASKVFRPRLRPVPPVLQAGDRSKSINTTTPGWHQQQPSATPPPLSRTPGPQLPSSESQAPNQPTAIDLLHERPMNLGDMWTLKVNLQVSLSPGQLSMKQEQARLAKKSIEVIGKAL